ncbi:MAG: hypothetical protein KJ718_04095 [Nanoarchaeota archaeon]|nr:hypothetical protein [Nanoarchaeota archaeon]MBU1051710.1 hypothetical protein [Nanoarchaeota archaeon]
MIEISLEGIRKEFDGLLDSELERTIKEANDENHELMDSFKEKDQQIENKLARMNPITRFFYRLSLSIHDTDPNPFPWILITPFSNFKQRVAEGILNRRNKNGTNKYTARERLVENFEKTMACSDCENGQNALHGDDLSEGRVLTAIRRYVCGNLKDMQECILRDQKFIDEHKQKTAEYETLSALKGLGGWLDRKCFEIDNPYFESRKPLIPKRTLGIERLKEFYIFLQEIEPLTLVENPLEAVTSRVKEYQADADKRDASLRIDNRRIEYASHLAQLIPSMKGQEEELERLRKERYNLELSQIQGGAIKDLF